MKRTLLGAALFGGLMQSTAAWSQQQDSTAPAQAPEDAAELPTVYVISEKSGRSIMNTATSAVVLDSDELEKSAGLNSAKDVLATIPNIVYVGTGNIAPAIRGIDSTGSAQGGDAFIAGTRARLNMQLDGRPMSYNEIVFGDSALWDTQQIEVLRGAQSTLQGRNALAGTIAIRTNDPTFTPEGAFRVAGGNYDRRRVSGLLSGPLSESVAYRLSADWSSAQSWVEGWPSYAEVQDPRKLESLNLRGKLLFEPSSIAGLRTLVTINHADYRGPQTESVDRPFDDRRSTYPFEPVFEPKTSSAIVDTQYRISSTLRFEGLLSGSDVEVWRKTAPQYGIAHIDAREYVFEPRLRYTGEGRQTGVVGLYLFKATQDEFIDIYNNLDFDDDIRTAALFGEGTQPLGESLDLIVGARYEQEKHKRDGGRDAVADFPYEVKIDLDETYRAFLPKLGLAWHVNAASTVGVQVSRGYNGGGAGVAVESPDDDQNAITRVTNYQYDPEYVWTYELWLRQTFADKRGRLTANLFYSDYRDMQLSYDLTPSDPSDYAFVVENADKVKTWGAEAGLSWLLAPGLEVFLNAGALKAEITRYPGSGYQGNELPNAPSFTASTGARWTRGRWDASFNARYSESYYSDIANQVRGKVDPYWVANAEAGVKLGPTRLYTEVTNLFDADDALSIFPGGTAANDSANLLAPRQFWVGIEALW